MLSLFKKRKLTQSQLFGLAAGGVLTESNYDPFDRINMSYGINSCKICLSDWWDVNSTFDLIKTIDWLFMEGHRFPLMESVLAIEEKNHCNEEVIFEDEKFAKFIFNNLYEIKRLGFISWDYSRIINLARWGFGAKYIKEDQAWLWIMKAAKKMQKKYSCWKDTGDDFIYGYRVWSMQFSPLPNITEAYERLVHSKNSVWNTIKWDTPLM